MDNNLKNIILANGFKDAYTLPDNDISYLENMLFNEHGNFNFLSYNDLKDIPQHHISLFCVRHGFYSLPTTELIEYLNKEIGKHVNDTIEVGAGNGIISNALGIMATDSFMQEREDIKEMYKTAGQEPVKYGKNVINCDGEEAIKRYQPKIVIASWLTHKYNPEEHFRGGNMYGVNEYKIIKKVKKYIFIGNENTHRLKPILKEPHKIYKPFWLLSRSMHTDKNVIYTWEKKK